MTLFERIFAIVIGEEGGFDFDTRDPGNWTGGQVGLGELKGTKYGISAASYPMLNILALTLDEARTIYLQDYWAKIAGDSLPPELALYIFDGAVNSGWMNSARWLQTALGVKPDGLIGTKTITAIPHNLPPEFIGRLLGTRIVFMSDTPIWPVQRNGWTTRVCALPSHAQGLML